MAVFKTESEPIWGSPENVRLSEAVPSALEQGIQSRPLVATPGATDALVAEDGHHGPAKPSSGLLERL